jgi:hypothetical protein
VAPDLEESAFPGNDRPAGSGGCGPRWRRGPCGVGDRGVLLQPALDQFRGAAVQFVGPPFDVGEHIDDPAQVVKVTAAAVPRFGCVHRVVGTPRLLADDRRRLRLGHLWFRVGVDGQVAVRAEIPGRGDPVGAAATADRPMGLPPLPAAAAVPALTVPPRPGPPGR